MDSYKLCEHGSPAANATRYAAFSSGAAASSWETGEDAVEQLVASAGTIKNLYIELAVAPGVASTAAFTLRKNGADTALTVTISGTDTTGSDTSNTVTFAAGDRINWKCVTSAVASGSTNPRISADYAGDTANESLLLGRIDATGDNVYYPIDGWGSSTQSTFVLAKQLIATAGTIKKLYVRLNTAPGAGNSRTFTVYKNGSTTALTLTISNTDTTGNDTTHSFTVAAGDKLALFNNDDATSAATQVSWGCVFTADTAGEFPILGGTNDDPSNSATEYITINSVNGTFGTWNATEANRLAFGRTSWVKNMYVELTTAPGAGNSYTFTLRNNAGATALSVAISEANTTGNDSEATGVAITNNDNLGLQSVPASTPTLPVEVSWGFTVTMTQPSADFTPQLYFS